MWHKVDIPFLFFFFSVTTKVNVRKRGQIFDIIYTNILIEEAIQRKLACMLKLGKHSGDNTDSNT